MQIRAGVLLAVWVTMGTVLSIVAVSAWRYADTVKAWIGALQQSYDAGPNPVWALRADAHVHCTCSLLACLWFGIGCRLFLPRSLPWLAMACTVLLALSDEMAQLGSEVRVFDWGDQAADGCGILLAIPLLILLRRLTVTQHAVQRAATNSRAAKERS